jgi:hypothetical protein
MFHVSLTTIEMNVLLGLVRRAVVNAQRRHERRHGPGRDAAFDTRKAADLRGLRLKLLAATEEGGAA